MVTAVQDGSVIDLMHERLFAHSNVGKLVELSIESMASVHNLVRLSQIGMDDSYLYLSELD